MKTLTPQQIREKNKLQQTEPWLYLYELDAVKDGSEKFCFVAPSQEDVVYDGTLYRPCPIAIGEQDETSEGDLNVVPVHIANVTRAIMPKLMEARGFVGHWVRILIVHKEHLDDPLSKIESVYKVLACDPIRADVVTLSLGHSNFLEAPFASERYIVRCRHFYRGPVCLYAGALLTCDKGLTTANGCVAHGVDSNLHPGRYGGFPGQPE
ncbi:MAG TPA: hypothetical protein VEL28_06745 [Candidatus Binatia bacterium]|nr:hypothetical protein [Candidatus Binatia bacterium]